MTLTFSYRQEEYDEKKELFRRYLKWSNKEKTWNYEDCSVDVVGMDKARAQIIVRRKNSGNSEFRGIDYEVNLMMGFVITDVKNMPTQLEFVVEQNDDKQYGEYKNMEHKESEKMHRDLKDVRITGSANEISTILKKIEDSAGIPPENTHIFTCDTHTKSEFMPVVYQPKIDAWNNFLREINVNEDSGKYEVTLVFEDEKLRKHVIFNFMYKILRFGMYRRTKDIERFYVDAKSENFTFPGIYSGNDTLFDDSTHNDKKEDGPAVDRKVRYHYQDNNHPIIFVNTSNHALAPHDNNHDFWKWEYIPWKENTPIKTEKRTKEQTEAAYKKF